MIHKYASLIIKDNTPSSNSTISGSSNWRKIRVVPIPHDKINDHKVSKYANVLSFKGFYSKKTVSYSFKFQV